MRIVLTITLDEDAVDAEKGIVQLVASTPWRDIIAAAESGNRQARSAVLIRAAISRELASWGATHAVKKGG